MFAQPKWHRNSPPELYASQDRPQLTVVYVIFITVARKKLESSSINWRGCSDALILPEKLNIVTAHETDPQTSGADTGSPVRPDVG